ncbi:MAG: hypothetical protein WCT40_05135, partial [Candidatus Magasanikbacteria bacterium]
MAHRRTRGKLTKNSFKKSGISFIFALACLALVFYVVLPAAASRSGNYAPGESLDPTDCSPGDPYCTVDAPLTATTTGNVNFLGNVYLGTVASGTWQGSALADGYISSATNWNNTYNSVTASSSSWTSAYNIVTASSSYWDLAHGWGNHALAGYLTAYTET